jgi:hypothetical protein
MNTNTKSSLYWLPRVLSILFALFISIFALDVFGEGYTVGETIIALFMHLIPTFLVVIALIIAWRWERIGAALFIALALSFLVMFGGEGWIIAGPLLLLGVLFLFDWQVNAQIKAG